MYTHFSGSFFTHGGTQDLTKTGAGNTKTQKTNVSVIFESAQYRLRMMFDSYLQVIFLSSSLSTHYIAALSGHDRSLLKIKNSFLKIRSIYYFMAYLKRLYFS
jgi:hypothetical protein